MWCERNGKVEERETPGRVLFLRTPKKFSLLLALAIFQLIARYVSTYGGTSWNNEQRKYRNGNLEPKGH